MNKCPVNQDFDNIKASLNKGFTLSIIYTFCTIQILLCNIVIIKYMYLTILYAINDFDLIWFLKNVYFNTVQLSFIALILLFKDKMKIVSSKSFIA
jgi:hypothetical protein